MTFSKLRQLFARPLEILVSLWPWAMFAIGMANLGAAFVYGVIQKDYSHGSYSLLIALGCLYARDTATN